MGSEKAVGVERAAKAAAAVVDVVDEGAFDDYCYQGCWCCCWLSWYYYGGLAFETAADDVVVESAMRALWGCLS